MNAQVIAIVNLKRDNSNKSTTSVNFGEGVTQVEQMVLLTAVILRPISSPTRGYLPGWTYSQYKHVIPLQIELSKGSQYTGNSIVQPCWSVLDPERNSCDGKFQNIFEQPIFWPSFIKFSVVLYVGVRF